MEALKDQSGTPAPTMGSSKLRYPLRSATRSKDGKPTITEPTISSASKRVRTSPAVSKSLSVLAISGKYSAAAKPPRRLSVPVKSAASHLPASTGSITPTSETRAKRLNSQGKSDTPLSEISKSANRRKFKVLSSVSYWLTQIKLSESASKHSISLGFFKLALDSGCEPLDRVREELKSYIRRHNLLAEQEETVKDLLQCYNIIEDLEQLKVSEPFSKLPEDVALKSCKDKNSLPSKARNRSIGSKSLNSDTLAAKKQLSYANKASYNKSASKSLSIKEDNSTSNQVKSQKSRTKPFSENVRTKTALDDSPTEPGEKVDIPVEEESPIEDNEDKENMDLHTVEQGGSIGEEIEVN